MSVIVQYLTCMLSTLPTDISASDSSISALRACISELESSIEALGASSARWEKLLPWFSVLVVVGVAAEVLGIIWDYRDEREGWRRGIVWPPSRPSKWKLAFEIAATFLVVFGVFGEFLASERVASINDRLRSKTSALRSESDQLLAQVTQEAGDARQSAADALGDAIRAKANSDDAKEESAAAEDIAGKAEDKARMVEEQAAALLARFEGARRDINSMRPRGAVLSSAATEIQSKLSATSSRRFAAELCGDPAFVGWEQRETWAVLANALGDGTKMISWGRCIQPPGITVFDSTDAKPEAKKAAVALTNELTDLFHGVEIRLASCNPEVCPSPPLSDPVNDPRNLVSKDNDLIVVLVAEDPEPYVSGGKGK